MAAKKAENSGSSKPKIISNITCVEDLKARWETARNWSPDYYNLKDDLVYLIVYDQLKVGEPFAGLLDHCPYLGEAETLDDCLTMRTFEHEGTTSPVVLTREKSDTIRGTVTGDAYVVDARTILYLDEMYQNNLMFTRINKAFRFLDQRRSKPEGGMYRMIAQGFIYLGDEDFFKEKQLKVMSPKYDGKVLNYKWPTPYDNYYGSENPWN